MSNISRRSFLLASGALSAGGALAAGLSSLAPFVLLGGCTPGTTPVTDTWLLVGQTIDKAVRMPSSNPSADGLYSLPFSSENGKFAEPTVLNYSLWAKTILADSTNNIVYACDVLVNNPDFADNGGGGDLFCYQMADDGSGTKLDSSLAYGSNPSALALSADGSFLGTAIAGGGGTATVINTNEAGQLELGFCYSETSFLVRKVEHNGSVSAVCDRYLLNPGGVPSSPTDLQLAPNGRFFLLCDSNANKLYSFTLSNSGEITLASEPFVQPDDTRGAHSVFHPTNPWVYVASGCLPQLLALSYSEDGMLTQMQNVSPIERPEMYDERPDDYTYSQDFLCISKDGRFVYCGARLAKAISSEYELIAVFATDEETGLLKPVQYYFLENAHGAISAAISPDGKWLVVACRYSCELLVLKISENGLIVLHDRHTVPTPVSICWYQQEE